MALRPPLCIGLRLARSCLASGASGLEQSRLYAPQLSRCSQMTTAR